MASQLLSREPGHSRPRDPLVPLLGALVWSLLSLQGQDPSTPSTPSLPPAAPLERLEQRGATQWHVLRVDGREYVRFENVRDFYGFPTMDRAGDEVILEMKRPDEDPQDSSLSPETAGTDPSLRFLAGSRQAYLHGHRCHLSFAPLRYEDRLYLSRVDLALLIDPILRPSQTSEKDTPPVDHRVLLAAPPGDAFAIEVARHVMHGLEAFGLQPVTGESAPSPPETAPEVQVTEEDAAQPAPETTAPDSPSMPDPASAADVEPPEKAPLPTPETSSSAGGRPLAMLRIVSHAEGDEVRTLILAPEGTPASDEEEAPPSTATVPGNAHNRGNVALGMALHTSLMRHVEGVLDGGMRRDRSPVLREADLPATILSLPAATKAPAEVLGAAIVRGLRQFSDTQTER